VSQNAFTLLDNQTIDGNGPAYSVQDGGYRIIKATGVFGGASVTIEVDFSDNLWSPILAYQFTAPDTKEIQPLKTGQRLRAVLSSASGTTEVTIKSL